jgi:hypothetical protein
MTHRIVAFAERLLIALALAVVLALMPLPLRTPTLVVQIYVPGIILILVCYIGKLIIDTFFYDRYP